MPSYLKPIVDITVPPLLTQAEFLSVVPELPLSAEAAKNDRWINGVQWTSRPCEALGGAVDVACDAAAENFQAQQTRGEANYPKLDEQKAFLIWDAIQCSTISVDPGAVEAEAGPKFGLWLSSYIAAEAITGAASTGTGIADVADVLPAVSTVVATIGRLDQWLGSKIGNGQGMLHMSRLTLAHGVKDGVLNLRNGRYYSPAGHLIVADAGYQPGIMRPTGEAADVADEPWIFATGPVYVRSTAPAVLGSYLHERMDFTTDMVEVITQSYAIIVFDYCPVAAAQVELEAPVGS